MARLTHERVSGIKTGYWSPAKKDELIQKLGPIEEKGSALAQRVCFDICRHTAREDMTMDELRQHCRSCPMEQLVLLVIA